MSDTLFTLARNCDMHVDHNVEHISHQHVVKSTKDQIAGDGFNDTPAVDQLFGVVQQIFKDQREMTIYFLGEVRRWSGEHNLNKILFERSGTLKWFPQSAEDPGYSQPPARTYYPTRYDAIVRPTGTGPQQMASPPVTPAADTTQTTIIFNPGVETQQEALMRFGISDRS